MDLDTAKWTAGISDELAAKLTSVGLMPPRAVLALGELIESFIASRTDLKEGTVTNYRISGERMTSFFGKDKLIREITEGNADAWLIHLKKLYASATVARTVKHARTIFKSAVRNKLIDSNPFGEITAGNQKNKACEFFVTRELTEKVLEACPDAEWRLIFALCRYGGLRCPSEVFSLQWSDILWDQEKFLVRSTKKEHLEDGGERWVPIFPELRPYLEESFSLAEEGATHLTTKYRHLEKNMRTQFCRIVRRAGITPWPRLFQNLRSTRETELAQEWPIHIVCAWIGNSERVASDHYLQVTDDDFQRAAKSAAFSLQNPTLPGAAPIRTESQAKSQVVDDCEVMREITKGCVFTHPLRMTPTGFEPVSRP